MFATADRPTITTVPVLAPYYVRVHWSGQRRQFMVRQLKAWQRWRERRGVGRFSITQSRTR